MSGRNRWMVPALGLGITAAGMVGAMKLRQRQDGRQSPTRWNRLTPTTKTIVVNRAREDVYQFWLHVDQFPRFMRHLNQVSVRKDGQSHWVARGPGGQTYEWDAEIVESRPNELIAWRSLPGGDVQNEGSVRFERAPGGRGTLVRVNLRYAPPAGAAGAMVATLLGREPGQEVQEDLRRFKQIMETGEVVLSDATVHVSPHPARPPEGTFRLPKEVPGAGPPEGAVQPRDHGRDDEDRQDRRLDAAEVAVAGARGGDR